MSEETNRLMSVIESSIDEALKGSLVDGVTHYLEHLKSRGFLGTEITVAIDQDADLDQCAKDGRMPLVLSGPAHAMWPLFLKGRDTLPFPVPSDPPADLDPRIVAHMGELHSYYDDHMTWGAVHVVLDDGNVSDDDVDFCITNAEQRGDPEGADIARLLREVSVDQRLMLHQWWYGRGPFSVGGLP